jgi:hypothetical protein
VLIDYYICLPVVEVSLIFYAVLEDVFEGGLEAWVGALISVAVLRSKLGWQQQ